MGATERTAHLGTGSTKIGRVYKTAKADLEFRQAILTADGDKLSTLFPDTIEEGLIANMYYGYLVAKHGDDWHLYIK